MTNFSHEWLRHLSTVLNLGEEVSPRGKLTKELPQATLAIDMRYPVLMVPTRKLNYQFMAAEACWILSGDDRVATIALYNKRIAEFSDDGERFFGAYGPKIATQLPYVIEKLDLDKHTRQAGLTIWRENPPATKDVPCTVAIFFSIRQDLLNCHVFMRSSDVWLGVPYDVFNFSMLTHLVCGHLNLDRRRVAPGLLFLTAASSHLYEENFETARECLAHNHVSGQWSTPDVLFSNPVVLMQTLSDLRQTKPGDPLRWWEK